MQGVIGPIIGVVIVTLLVLIALSFDTLEYQEMGLNYSWITQSVEDRAYNNGRFYIGLGNHFIKFPQMVRTIYFVDDVTGSTQGPALQSRTRDGLNVRLEVSFQYKLKFDELYALYTTLGSQYEKTFVRMAIEQLTVAATMHEAHAFFNNRTVIGDEMHQRLDAHFREHAFAVVPFFQLRTVHLPTEFEDAIQDTQVKEQEIQIAVAEQRQNRVRYQTQVLQAEQQVKVLRNQAEAEAKSIVALNDAYCAQYRLTQQFQSGALKLIKATTGWSSGQLLDYCRVRAVREHPSENTLVSL